MDQSSLLASLHLGDRSDITIRLLQPTGRPPLVEIQWPQTPTVTSTGSYDQVVSNVMRCLAVSSVALSNRKAYPK